ncbi:MAG: hypothetical protein HFJ79_03425 [Clostridiales bacterium]|nr:hypothetical protein [Clostridiales bacterium]
MEKNEETRREDCPCRRLKCPRWGLCSACLRHHEGKRVPPACKQKSKPERKPRGREEGTGEK